MIESSFVLGKDEAVHLSKGLCWSLHGGDALSSRKNDCSEGYLAIGYDEREAVDLDGESSGNIEHFDTCQCPI